MSSRVIPIRLFCVHVILFGSLFLASFIAEAQMKIVSTLQCHQAFDPNAPTSVAGELHDFDLRYTADGKVQVTYTGVGISNGALFSADDTLSAVWDDQNGQIAALWSSKASVSLVKAGGKWQGAIDFPSTNSPVNPFSVPTVKLACGAVRW